MNYRKLGKTGFEVSEISLGTWQLGSRWGDPFNEEVAQQTLEAALANGINMLDTADIYQDGCSERAIGRFLKAHPDKRIYVVTKMGRALNPHVAEGYNEENLRRFVNQSREQMGVDALDILVRILDTISDVAFDNFFSTLTTIGVAGGGFAFFKNLG